MSHLSRVLNNTEFCFFQALLLEEQAEQDLDDILLAQSLHAMNYWLKLAEDAEGYEPIDLALINEAWEVEHDD